MTRLFTEAPILVKVLTFFLAWFVIWLPIAIPLALKLKWRPPQPVAIEQKVPLVLSLYLIAPLILGAASYLEGVPVSAYGIIWSRSALSSLAIGLSLGTGGVYLLFGLECWLGWALWQRSQQRQLVSVLLPTLGLGLIVSAIEEPVFRGFLLNQLQQQWSPGLAALGSSLVFALLHLMWEGRSGIPQLPGLWLMGMVLVLARWVDGGRLGLACGLHAGWVWAIASLDSAEIISYTDRNPEWMTGIAKQPLAGVIGILLLLMTGGVLWGSRA